MSAIIACTSDPPVITQNPTIPAPTPDPTQDFQGIDIPVVGGTPKPVFGNRVIFGGGAALSYAETYTAGKSELAVSVETSSRKT